MSSMLQNGNAESVQQVVRCIINITFDNHCRYICSKSGITAKLKNASTRLRDKTVTDLTNTACSNLEVSVAKDIEKEVDDAMRTGRVTKVSAPTASMKDSKKDDFEGLDDLLGPGKNKPAAKPAYTKPKPTNNDAFDDLDSLLDSGPSNKPSNTYNKPASKPPTTSYNKPAAKPVQNNNDFDDLDSLLDSGPSHKQPASKPPTFNKPASKPAAKPAHNNDFDDLDSLLDSGPSKNYQTKSATTEIDLDDLLDITPSKGGHKHQDDDIDSLLADIGGGKHNSNDDDLDDLLSGISGGSHGHNNDDIDDLLADLTK